MYQLLLCKADGNKDIYGLTDNITWSDNIDTLGMELCFDKAHSDEQYIPHTKVSPGDKLVLINGTEEIFRGIITEESFGDRFSRSYKAYDYAFYLNKSEVVIQFNGITASAAITELCAKVGVPVGSITSISTNIKKIYKDVVVSDVITDILEKATNELGIKYRFETRAGKLYIEPYTNMLVVAKYQPASNLPKFDATHSATLSGTRSINDMKNAVVVTGSGESSAKILAEVKDNASISKYGLLQEVETVDDSNVAAARNIASLKLKELNRISETFSMDMMGADNVRAGRVIYIKDEYNSLDNIYLIKSCTHTLANGNHTMSIELGVI